MNYIKRTVAFACVAMLGLGLFSCKKCTTCNIVDDNGDILAPGQEVCGKSSAIEKAKDDAEAASASWPNAKVECTD